MTKAMGRGLDILWAMVQARQPHTAAELATAIGINRASAYRLLEALTQEGWLVADGQPRRYSVTLRVAEMGALRLVNDRVRQVVLPYMMDLAQAVQNRVLLNFYERGSVVITDVVDILGERAIPTLSASRVPAACTASGKVLLAYQPVAEVERVSQMGLPAYTTFTKTSPTEITAEIFRSRERGYGTVDRELQPEHSSLGVPVFDDTDQAVAAFGMSLSGPLTDEMVARVLGPARQSAQRASIALGHRPASLMLVS